MLERKATPDQLIMFANLIKGEERIKLPDAIPKIRCRLPVTVGQFACAGMGKLIGIGDNRVDILAHVGGKPGNVAVDFCAIWSFGKNMSRLLTD